MPSLEAKPESSALWQSPKKAGAIVGLDVRDVRELIHGGRIEYMMVGSHYRVYVPGLDSYLHKISVKPRGV